MLQVSGIKQVAVLQVEDSLAGLKKSCGVLFVEELFQTTGRMKTRGNSSPTVIAADDAATSESVL